MIRRQKDSLAVGAISAGLFAIAIVGGITDLRRAGKAQPAACAMPTSVAAEGDATGCAAHPDRHAVYYRARMDALAQN